MGSTNRTTQQTRDSMAAKPWADPGFAKELADFTMKLYYRSPEPESLSRRRTKMRGFCIPVRPTPRLTDSPTGGVVGRYLALRSVDGSAPSLSYSASTRTSLDSQERVPVDMGNGSGQVVLPKQLPGGEGQTDTRKPAYVAEAAATVGGLFQKVCEASFL